MTDGGVRLRELEEGDAEQVVAWRNRSDVESQLFAAAPPSLESHRRWFERYRVGNDRREFIIVAEERPVGTVCLADIDRVHRRAEYGILLGDPSVRGRGIGHRASELVLEHAFTTLGLERIYLSVFADNAAAIRLYERLGFQHEGLLRHHVYKAGEPRNVVVMGLLVGEFEARIRA